MLLFVIFLNMPENFYYKTNLNKKTFSNYVGNSFPDKMQYTSCLFPKNCKRSRNFKIATRTIAA